MSFLLIGFAVAAYVVTGLVFTRQSLEVIHRKELGTLRSRFLFPRPRGFQEYGLHASPLKDIAEFALGENFWEDFKRDEIPVGYYLLTMLLFPFLMMYGIMFGGIFRVVGFLLRKLFTMKVKRKPDQSWVRLEAPRKVSEEESLEVQMEELEASRQWRKVCLLNADKAETRIQELEAKLEQPQDGAYRGQIPAKQIAKKW